MLFAAHWHDNLCLGPLAHVNIVLEGSSSQNQKYPYVQVGRTLINVKRFRIAHFIFGPRNIFSRVTSSGTDRVSAHLGRSVQPLQFLGRMVGDGGVGARATGGRASRDDGMDGISSSEQKSVFSHCAPPLGWPKSYGTIVANALYRRYICYFCVDAGGTHGGFLPSGAWLVRASAASLL
jgi:hypothetical protein